MTQKKNVEYSMGKKVVKIDLKGKVLKKYKSVNAAARSLKNSSSFASKRSSIVSCCMKKQKTAYGYKWKYAK